MHWSCAWSSTFQWPRNWWKNWLRRRRWKNVTLKKGTRSLRVSEKCVWHSASTTWPPRSSHSVATESRSGNACFQFIRIYINITRCETVMLLSLYYYQISLLCAVPFQAGPGLQWCQSSLTWALFFIWSYSTSLLFIQSIIVSLSRKSSCLFYSAF